MAICVLYCENNNKWDMMSMGGVVSMRLHGSQADYESLDMIFVINTLLTLDGVLFDAKVEMLYYRYNTKLFWRCCP